MKPCKALRQQILWTYNSEQQQQHQATDQGVLMDLVNSNL